MVNECVQNHILGIDGRPRNLHFVLWKKVGHLIYTVGLNVVVYNLKEDTQTVWHPSKKCASIYSVAVAKDASERLMLSLCEQSSNDRPLVTLLEITSAKLKQRTLVLPPPRPLKSVSGLPTLDFLPGAPSVTDSHPVSSVFSVCAKFLFVLRADGELSAWQWQDHQCVATARIFQSGATTLTLGDLGLLAVYGVGGCLVQLFKFPMSNQRGTPFKPEFKSLTSISLYTKLFKQLQLKAQGQPYTFEFVSHFWDQEEKCLLVGNKAGDLVKIDHHGEVLGLSVQGSPRMWGTLDVLCPWNGGFVAGGLENLFFYEKRDRHWHITREMSLEWPGQPPPSGEHSNFGVLACVSLLKEASPHVNRGLGVLLTNQTCVVIQPTADLLAASWPGFQPILKDSLAGNSLKAEFLFSPAHMGRIKDVSMALHQPWAATCGVDHSLRIWNLETLKLEALRYLPREPVSLSFHSSGHFILVATPAEILLVANVLNHLEIIRTMDFQEALEVRFAPSSHVFGVLMPDRLCLYDYHQWSLRAEVDNKSWGAQSLLFSQDDQLVVVGLKTPGHVQIFQASNLDLLGVLKPHQAVMSGGCGGSSWGYELITHDWLDIGMASSQRRLMVGGDPPYLLLVPMNFFVLSETPTRLNFSSTDCPGNALNVQVLGGLALGHHHLVVAGREGGLHVIKLPGGISGQNSQWSARVPAQPVRALASQAAMDSQEKKLKDLRLEVANMEKILADTLAASIKAHHNRLSMVEAQDLEELEGVDYHIEEITKATKEAQNKQGDILESARQRHQDWLHHRVEDHQTRVKYEQEKYAKLSMERMAANLKSQEKLAEVEAHFQARISQENQEYADKLQAVHAVFQSIVQEKLVASANFRELAQTLEDLGAQDLEELRLKFEENIATEAQDHELLISKEASSRNLQQEGKTEYLAAKDRLGELEKENQRQHRKLEGARRELACHQADLQSQKLTVLEKDRQVAEYRDQCVELDKVKYVLTYRQKEVRETRTPITQEIHKLDEEVNQKEAAIKLTLKSNQHLELNLKDQQMKTRSSRAELQSLQSKTWGQQREYAKAVVHLLTCCACENLRVRKQLAIKIYKKYVLREKTLIKDKEYEARDLARKEAYMDKTTQSLRKKVSQSCATHKLNTMAVFSENVTLIREINCLRRELQTLINERSRIKQKIEDLQQGILDAAFEEGQLKVVAQHEEINRLNLALEGIMTPEMRDAFMG